MQPYLTKGMLQRMGQTTPDDQLLQRSQCGDERSFGELVDRHAPYLLSIARASLRSVHDAEDVVQECLAAALKARFDGSSAVRTWLVGILLRQIALSRRRWRRWRREKDQPPPQPVSDATAAVDARLDLAELLSRLDEDQRQVIILRELEQMSYDQIAEVLNVPRGTVESRLHRARQQLKQMLKKQ
ncbi:MAG: RNA polymerase sigma factor [Phycisphaerales bacterium]|nr:RNA polymerase sigma factor [Phycisphaerales bacterium]